MRILLPMLICTIALTACNTIQGAGRDVTAVGKAVETGAKKVKRAITD
ncbi:MAG: entericidin [Pseudomonadota bacterium]